MLKYAVLILWRKKGVAANFYAFCISDEEEDDNNENDGENYVEDDEET